jgi:hypothetical protein
VRAKSNLVALGAIVASVVCLGGTVSAATNSPRRVALTSAEGLTPHNVTVAPARLHGKSGVRVTMTDELRDRVRAMTPDELRRAAERGETEQLVILEGFEFGDGVIEAEIAGEAQTSVFEGARGFVGIAFRVQKDLCTYDSFYLRPTNGRADDQVRRNHSAQYIAHPDWPWFRLRREFPEKYESYVDLVPGEWTKIRIEVRGEQARLYVHGAKQPTLIVNDLKSGKNSRGAVALWIDLGTVAHFRNVVVTP